MAEATTTTTTTDGATPPASSTDGDGTAAGTTTTTPPEGDLGDAGKKALDAERDARKQAEKAARDANRQLEELRRQNMSDNEKALDIAKEEGRAEVRALLAPKLVGAEVRAATAGRNIDAAALVEGIDATKFLGDDGEVDTKAIGEWIDRVAPKSSDDDGTKPPAPSAFDFGQGTRGAPDPDAGEQFVKGLLGQLGR